MSEEFSSTTWKLWQDGAVTNSGEGYFGYQLNYPRDFDVYSGEQARGNLIGTPRVTIAFPQDAFLTPKSNYGEAYLTLSVDDNVNDCYKNPNPSAPDFSEEISLYGAPFKMGTSVEPAAGNIYTSEIYRGVQNNECYEIALTVHTGNIYNYDPGTVVEFDTEKAFRVLRQILGTFRFMEKNPYL